MWDHFVHPSAFPDKSGLVLFTASKQYYYEKHDAVFKELNI
jgi:hypothetical protein